MAANNETGVIQPIADCARLVHAAGGILHVDAVQAAGRIPININELGADLLTLSGHKLGGPKSTGALVRRVDDAWPSPLITGGGQERGLRAGTENVAGIAGFGAAATAAQASLASFGGFAASLGQRLEHGIRSLTPDAVIFGAGSPRLPNTTLVSRPGMKAETAVIAFDLAGIAVSSGAACSSGKVQPSHVLAAMGVPPALAQGAVRVSWGETTTEFDIECFLNAWNRVSGVLRNGSHGIAA